MQEKKLGTVLLCGLMIGPVLGSGIILLPPIVYKTAGDWAIVSWGIMMLISLFFAWLFGRLSIKFPGDAGIANAVEYAFGMQIKRLAALFLIGGACFGPIAVLTIAAQYLDPVEHLSHELLGFGLLVLGAILLLRKVSSIGKIAFVLSSSVAAILFFSALYALAKYAKTEFFQTAFSFSDFGYSLLLLFWAIVGWEIVGNYSAEVRNPAKTIPKAVFLSATTVLCVSLTVAAGIQWIDYGESSSQDISVTRLISPLFDGVSAPLMGMITAALCMTTYLLVIGGVSRLIASQAEEGFFPAFLGRRTAQNVPFTAVLALSVIHSLVFAGLALGWLDIEHIVAIANGFFLSNALCGILAAIRIFPTRSVKITAGILGCCFVGILLFSSLPVLSALAALTAYFVRKQQTHRRLYPEFRVEIPS